MQFLDCKHEFRTEQSFSKRKSVNIPVFGHFQIFAHLKGDRAAVFDFEFQRFVFARFPDVVYAVFGHGKSAFPVFYEFIEFFVVDVKRDFPVEPEIFVLDLFFQILPFKIVPVAYIIKSFAFYRVEYSVAPVLDGISALLAFHNVAFCDVFEFRAATGAFIKEFFKSFRALIAP